ncbi:hypothetical protein [Aeromicrobium sp. CTD01-1L150]|uniref:hypothetical protein n=1 Tax=Aeromicrobium sp. CTD01-1L150 TaxID=3341830 RepID=UPI0035C0D225
MREQPLTTGAAVGLSVVVLLVWTLGLLGGDLAGAPLVETVELGGPAEYLWRLACGVAGLFVVLAARPALRRLDPNARAGAAALLVQLGGVALLLLAAAPAKADDAGAVVLQETDPVATYGTVATLVLGALVPAAGFLLAARWRSDPARRTETVVSFVTSTLALWAMLAYSLAPEGDWSGLAQRVSCSVALGWVAWLFTRSLDPQQRSG